MYKFSMLSSLFSSGFALLSCEVLQPDHSLALGGRAWSGKHITRESITSTAPNSYILQTLDKFLQDTTHCMVSTYAPSDWKQRQTSPWALLCSSMPKWIPKTCEHVWLLKTALLVTLLDRLSSFLLHLFNITFSGCLLKFFSRFHSYSKATEAPVWKKSCHLL